MTTHIMLITYSFDPSYVAVPCSSEKEAIECLHNYLDEEIRITKEECEYTHEVREYSDIEVELVYAGDDVATYRVIEIGHGFRK